MEVSLKVRHFGLCGMNYNLKCSYITDLWRRLGVIYRQSNSSERVVDYFEATVDRFRGTGKPNFRKFRFELMLR